MSETVVLCGGAAEAARSRAAETLRLDLSGSKPNVSLQIEDISRRMVANISAVLTDVLEVATYVYCADQLVSRGGGAGRALGADWRRRWQFVIPVREPDLWSSPEVSANLARLLAFLSDEDFSFDFEGARSPASAQSYFDFDQDGAAFAADKVALFSGGLDSLAGAVEAVETGSRIVLVSHQSSTKLAGHQRYLTQELRSRFPDMLLHVPVRITKTGLRTVESTQRTRSFLFAALAFVVARLLGKKSIRFYENGVVSINLPIANQVVGARATRSTHPRTIQDLQALFSALVGEPIEVENPYVWNTKTEVAGIVGQTKHTDLLAQSVSCSKVYELTRHKTHCGACSQCLDRRFAVLAGGLDKWDPEEMYEVDLLTGAREAGADRTMAENYVRHARELVAMTDMGFIGRFGGLLARVASAYSDLSANQVMQNAIDLHKRHGNGIVSVLENGFKSHANALAQGTLPDSCLLRLVGAIEPSAIRDPVEMDHANERRDNRDFRRTSEILLALNSTKHSLVVAGIEPIRGEATFALTEILVEAHDRDRSTGLAPENHRYVSTRTLTKTLGASELALRRRVERLRRKVAESYEKRFGLVLAGDALIQSRSWQGYRLNPYVRVVREDQIIVETRHEKQDGRHETIN